MNTKNKAAGANQTACKNLTGANFTKILSQRKKFPPYGNLLFEAAQKEFKPHNDIFIFVGKYAWNKAKAFLKIHWATLIPDDTTSPTEYRWDFVKNLPVLVMVLSQIDYELIRQLCCELLEANAEIVRVLLTYLIKPEVIVFRQEA